MKAATWKTLDTDDYQDYALINIRVKVTIRVFPSASIMLKLIGDVRPDSGRAAGSRVRKEARHIKETGDNITAGLDLVNTRR